MDKKYPLYINAGEYGLIKEDSSFDNSLILQPLLDGAQSSGCYQVAIPPGVYYFNTTLNIPAGVQLMGAGTGSDPLNTSPIHGTVLRYIGGAWAIKMSGHSSAIKDLVLDDKGNAHESGNATGAIHILADNKSVESTRLNNLLIMSFTEGTALKLEAINFGGISYGMYTGVRMRHPKVGVHIIEDNDSYVNSNRFNDGVMSGAQCQYGLLIEGGNNNIFNSQVIEPVGSTMGHVVVNKGEITAHDIRLEGNSQPTGVPIIVFGTDTRGSKITGLSEGKGYLDNGDNFVNIRCNSIGYNNTGINVFENSSLKQVNETSKTIGAWELSNTTNTTLEVLTEAILPNHNVLRITVPVGEIVELLPKTENRPKVFDTERYFQANFGAFIKVTFPAQEALVQAKHHANGGLPGTNQGVTVSYPHPGDGIWRFIGMTAQVLGAQNVFPSFRIENNTSNALVVDITTPTYVFGTQSMPQLESNPITSAGGEIFGLLSTGLDTVIGINDLVLPRSGNVFEVEGTNLIQRINHDNTRLPKGTVVTLLFKESGLVVINNGYIELLGGVNYTSILGSSLTLLSIGNGTWKELNRNI
jgi:hypothetical protein